MRKTAFVVTCVSLGLAACAVTTDGPSEIPDSASAARMPEAAGPVAYRSPLPKDAPATRIGGSNRGAGGNVFALNALGPDHVGLTAQGQPTLFWFASDTVRTPTEITIIQDGAIDPLLEVQLAPPLEPGMHTIRLAEHRVQLERDRDYQWFVTLVTDPAQRSRDVVTGAEVRRATLPGGIKSRVSQAGPRELPQVYAEAGYWYDAVSAVSDLVDKNPDDGALREMRASLLEQVGLAEAAAFERAEAR